MVRELKTYTNKVQQYINRRTSIHNSIGWILSTRMTVNGKLEVI